MHPDVVWREIDGEIVLLNLATGLYYGLDEAGSSVWRQFAAVPMSLEAVRDALLTQYDAAPTAIEQDLLALVGQLADTQLVVVSSA